MARKTFMALGALLAMSSGALAQQQPITYRWATGYGQGVLQAMIRSPDQSYVAFNCSNGQFQQGPTISVDVNGRSLDGPKTLQLVVDGQNLTMPLLNGVVDGNASDSRVAAAARAISASNAPSFVAAIPEMNWQQEFSLGNARAVLTEPSGGTIVERCSVR